VSSNNGLSWIAGWEWLTGSSILISLCDRKGTKNPVHMNTTIGESLFLLFFFSFQFRGIVQYTGTVVCSPLQNLCFSVVQVPVSRKMMLIMRVQYMYKCCNFFTKFCTLN
jgi:hypothetical protein